MILHIRNKLTLIPKLIQVPNQNPIYPFPHLILRCIRERRWPSLRCQLRCRLPPLKMVTYCLTLPPSNNHHHGGLLLHTAYTALLVLPPHISDQPILVITLFPLYNPVKRNIYGHVWIFLFLNKNVWIFCVCVRVRLDTFVAKCIQVNTSWSLL